MSNKKYVASKWADTAHEYNGVNIVGDPSPTKEEAIASFWEVFEAFSDIPGLDLGGPPIITEIEE